MQRFRTLLQRQFLLAFIAILCFPLLMKAQTMSEWDNVSVFQMNREVSHDLSIPFASAERAKTLDLTQSPYYLDLNGTWKFHWSANPDQRPKGFADASYDVSGWDVSRVTGMGGMF